MLDSYHNIGENTIGEFKDRGSRFIAYLVSVSSLDEFKDELNKIKAAHIKARHFCTAIRLLPAYEKSNDDGEPSGSAGKPILNQLLSHDLKNVACIVVRYFGGTKLGVSGLINAYKQATREAIDIARIEERFITRSLKIHFDYAVMGKLLECLKKLGISEFGKQFNEQPFIELDIRVSEYEDCLNRIKAKWLNRDVADLADSDVFEGLRFEELDC